MRIIPLFLRLRTLILGLLLAGMASAQSTAILVVGSDANLFGRYNTEILLAEGLNSFSYVDISAVTAGTLSAHDVVVLGEMPLSSGQATLFANWVDSGGNLIAMRPHQQLAGLLGISPTGTTLADAYLQVDVSTAPGAGIVGETIQFHGVADRYTLSGAAAVAMLYSNSTTATANPAVTLRNVGANGGQAAAFTFDLARSVVYTRQGNPAWEGQERDGLAPIRSDDLFYGAASFDPQPDWVDHAKVGIPQADEQQRLLANLILYMNQDKKPLPRFWYLPFGKKAAVVMTGDDHANNGTAGRFDSFLAASEPGCSVENWECIRGTSYIYPNTPIGSGQANAYNSVGFEIALHLNTGCSDYTLSSLQDFFANQLVDFGSVFSGLPSPTTNRNHCIVFSDWSSLPTVEASHGIRLDTTYYYWPPTWVADTPGFFTGSGIPMRFADLNGATIDVYQATSQMTDESVQSYPFTIDTLLDNALGPLGYYGVFTANIHTDSSTDATQTMSDQIVASAKARTVPVVTARQMLEWVDGRNESVFTSISWAGSTLSFAVSAGEGSNGIRAMVPAATTAGSIVTLSRNGTPIVYTTSVIKGIDYAFFDALTGSYAATYSTVPLTISLSPTSATLAETETANFVATVTGAPDSSVTWSLSPNLGTITSTGPSSATYQAPNITTGNPQVTVTATSVANPSYFAAATVNLTNTATSGTSVGDTTVADFSAGSGTNFYIAETADGEVTLLPGAGAEFSGSIPAGWTGTSWGSGGAATIAGGSVNVDGARFGTDALFTPGRALEFIATFGVTQYQYVGLGVDYNSAPWAMFGTGGGSTLTAFTSNGSQSNNTVLGAGLLGASHLFRIEWNSGSVVFYVDGAQVASHATSIAATMRPLASDYIVGGPSVTANWIRMAPYAQPGTFTSRVLDAGTDTLWGPMTWNADVPAGSGIQMSVRTGNTPTPDAGWSAFSPVGSSGTSLNVNSRYIQYQAVLTTSDVLRTPSLGDVTIRAETPITSVNATNVTVDSATITWTTSEPADSQVEYGTTLAYGQATALNPSFVTAHSVPVTGLNSGTQYHFRVRSRDAQSNLWLSDDYVFTTQAPPVISALSASADLTTATITWTTDKVSTSRVDYGTSPTALTQSVSNPAMVTSHSIQLSGLANATTYYYRVTSVDAASNSGVFPKPPAAPQGFATLDPNPAIISGVVALPGLQSIATIRWDTHKPANSRVDYGTSPGALNSSVSDPAMVAAHSVRLTGLATGTAYYFRVTSTDTFNNVTVSPPLTDPPASFVENVISIWDAAASPSVIAEPDTVPIQVGLKFQSTASGLATGLLFYKAPTNTGTHVGSLWASDGTLLASVTFTDETASGWQQASFPTPVAILPNTTYVVSYLAPNGRYSLDEGYFASSGVSNGPLRALADGDDGPNGVYRYGSAASFPNLSFASSNYWVDVIIVDNIPPVISGASASAASQSAVVTWTTNEPATARVDYGTSPTALSQSVNAATVGTSHSVSLTGLVTSTTYYYRITSLDTSQNAATSPILTDPPSSFTTGDGSPPVISGVSAATGSTAALITWATNVPASSRVEYGTSAASLTQVADVATLVTSHAVTLNGLSASTTYFYRVSSTDVDGNGVTAPQAPNPPLSFTTSGTGGSGGSAISIWPAGTPLVIEENDPSSLEVGLRFQSRSPRKETGVRYYKGPSNTRTHIGNLWSSNGTQLASATFTNETASGWQTTFFPVPINIAANTTYVVSYFAPVGRYSIDGGYFSSSGATNGPLTALGDGEDGPNGLYRYGSSSAFPNSSYNSSNYWVDVLFVDTAPPIISNVAVTPGSASAVVTWTTNKAANARVDYGTSPGELNQNVTVATSGTSHSVTLPSLNTSTTYYYRVTSVDDLQNATTSPVATDPPNSFTTANGALPTISNISATAGTVSALVMWTTNVPANSRVEYGTSAGSLTQVANDPALVTSHSVTFNGLTEATAYFYRVVSADLDGNSATSPSPPASPLSFTTSSSGGGGGSAISIWPTQTPSVAAENDTSAVELGVKFRSNSAGVVAGIRFYKGAGNTGVHVGNLWSSTGVLLATVNFQNETASGWQEAVLSSPVNIAANTSYVASYFAPVGRYSVDGGYFAGSGASNGALTALADGEDGPNGLYTYGSTSGFPNSSYNSSNYWVDVLFLDNAPPSISNLTVSPGGTTAVVSWTTNKPTDARVDFGTSPGALTQNVAVGTLGTSHSVTLTGLTPSTVYYYRATSTDASQNVATSPVATDPPGSFTTTDGTPPTISNINANAGSGAALISWTTNVPASSRVEYGTSAGSLNQVVNDTGLVTSHGVALSGLTPSTVYFYRVSSTNVDGASVTSPVPPAAPLSFTTSGTGGGGGLATSIWPTGTPSVIEENDASALELGVRFRSTSAGQVTGVRFYKGPGNTGTHIGNLWTGNGNLLATVTFANETASGWQEAFFSTPVNIVASTTYVVSYFAPVGRYSVDGGYFSGSGTTNGSLTALLDGEDGPNGLYRYASTSGFPSSSYNSSNYWVDVLFVGDGGESGSPPSEWDISGAGDPSIQGFTTDISYNVGETVRFKIDTDATAYHLDIYRMGYYQGNGALRVATVNPSASLPQNQPPCLEDVSTGLIDCGSWAESASWTIPTSAKSGIYFAKVIRDSGSSGASHIVFVVRDDSSTSDIIFQTSDTTWQAYNRYGGNSLYTGSPVGRAYKVSYNRPFTTREYAAEDWVFNAEYPMVRWLEANGYDVTYTTGIDTDRRGHLLTNHNVFMSVGHDEYWSGNQRANVEAARNAGVNLVFLSGNEVFWKTRWEDSISAGSDAYRTLTCYKETHDNAKIDPSPEWTGTWRDSRFSPPSDAGRPENELTGTIFTVNCCTYEIQVPEADGKMRFWRNTSIANLSSGQTATLASSTLGYEWDEDLDNGFRPAGLIRLSTTTEDVAQKLQDLGSNYGPGTATHAMTLYRHSSGALVFGAGTVQWTWGLDSNHDRGSAPSDIRMRQATVNLLADMGIQPASLQPDLVPATQSTDVTPPTSLITSPAPGANVNSGVATTITGTAVDSGGGIVGGVEVSVDGGATWYRANGRSNWTYSWTPTGSGSVTIMSRASDDIANVQGTPTSITVNVQ